ncbi:MAG: hypothetical protein IH897_03300 [Planctomycetes bacterium]|nr:hypothetical protein [Planctomycetota bacterium]
MPCGDPFDSECNPADTCDGAGTCLGNVKDDGTSCLDDLAFCTGEESCQGGFCESAGDPCTAEGLLCDLLAEQRNECSCDPAVEDVCDDDVFCTGEEICDDGVCFSPGDPCAVLGQLCDEDRGECVECLTVDDCQDDGNDCTETVCRDGACEHDDLAHNTPCGSDLDDDCTEPDTCAVGVCQANDEPAGTNCGDQSEDEPVCNPKDTCDGNGTCLDNIPPNDTPCADDGVFCTGSESCQGAVCESEGDPCTADGLICDDIAEIRNECSCDPAVEGACDDGNECTIDECVAGACNHEAVPDFPVTACTDDGVFCNGEEICNAGECFSPGNPCETGEVCNEDNDICNCDSDDDCAEDGLACNGEEICSGGVCISAGDPCLANVTTPVCIEPTGSCECGTDLHCDDGKVCNGAETCVNGGCVDGADKCDSDQVCNEQENRCEECETGDDDDCNDGDNCTVDRCPFGMCVHEMLPECEDDDEDGVINAEDQCPGTPQDAQDVDAIGCTCADAIDTDHDGVIDCNDECDDTPLRESANSSGCSCSQLTGDSDGDGVANACDDCAFTPSGESVDGNGCGQSQIDSDQDGVMNDVDDCPGSPTGIEVGDDGCPVPVDNDNDNDNDNGDDNGNDNGGANDNDNGNDNGTDNTNDNAGDNGNDNEPGQDVPGDEPAPRLCGLFGMINLVFLGLGMVAMRVTRRRHRRSRR